MSVTNEEVSGSSASMTGSGATTPTAALPRQVSTTSSTASLLSTSTVIPSSPSPMSGENNSSDIVKSGNLRKLKGKKKFFVLCKETDGKPARLEYYASEKKYKMGHPPRKSIVLKTCFNISGPTSVLESNLKTKYSISLHTHNDCVRISLSNEEEMNDWLRAIKALSEEEEDEETVEGKPHFEHIWMVHALNKGLGSKENIIGPYRLCLTSKELTLLKVGEHGGRNGQVRFPLNVIRNVSHDATFGCFFYIQLGRLACTGAGQLSLKTEDNNIAQNMHLLILKAMQNYSKGDEIIPTPTSRFRSGTWEANMRPSHSAAPVLSSSMDEPRCRTDSLPSTTARAISISKMSPPVPIFGSPPRLFSTPSFQYSTDSASSSSMDFDNNNHNSLLDGGVSDGKPNDDEEYVMYNPMEEPHISPASPGTMKLPFNSEDCVDSSKDSPSSTAQTPSSYMEIQSPLSSYDNYMPMSPGVGGSNAPTGIFKLSANGKVSTSHSRNSSLVEDNDGYVPMIPGQHSRSESGAGSTAGSATGLDDAYLDMDFTRKMNLSNDDMRRTSPTSVESLQSNTPSSDFPLEKVTSYLTDDFDDTMRPIRAYSVGSRSDTGVLGKIRAGKNRLEAVQETSRLRAMSVGSKNPRRLPVHSNTNAFHLSGSGKPQNVGPLSSSWSGSTGRWPLPKFQNYLPSAQQYTPTSSRASESADSDLMELDFSKNKKLRKRSHPGPPTSISSTPSSTSSNMQKLSPAPKGVFSSILQEGSPGVEQSDSPKSPQPQCSGPVTTTPGNYVQSAPISIQGSGSGTVNRNEVEYAYHDCSPQPSILSRLTGSDLKKLKEMDDEGAYLNMDFSKPPEKSNPRMTRASEPTQLVSKFNPVCSATPVTSASITVNQSSASTTCNGEVHEADSSKPTSAGKDGVPTSALKGGAAIEETDCAGLVPNNVAPSGLSRIEESPEKQEINASNSGSCPLRSYSRGAPLAKQEEDNHVTYASVPPVCKQSILGNIGSAGGPGHKSPNSCIAPASVPNNPAGVTYAQLEFLKSSEPVKSNN